MVLWGDQGKGLASALVTARFLSKGKAFQYRFTEFSSSFALTALGPGFQWLPKPDMLLYCTMTPQTRMQLS